MEEFHVQQESFQNELTQKVHMQQQSFREEMTTTLQVLEKQPQGRQQAEQGQPPSDQSRQQPSMTEQPNQSKQPVSPRDLEINLPEPHIRRVPRSDTAFQRLSTFRAHPREGVLTVESDRHMDITWNVKTVDGFLKFLEEADKFTLSYNQPIPYLFTKISDELQEALIELFSIHKPDRFSSKNEVYKANVREICEIVQVYFAPRDLGHFTKLLISSCEKV